MPSYLVQLLWQVLGCACHICLSCWCEARCWMETLAPRDARLCNGGWELFDRTTQHQSISKILTACLPKKVSDVFKIHWRPVFSIMEEGVGQLPENLTPEIVDDLNERATEYLQTRVSYIFWKDRLHHNDWVVATWAKCFSRSVIFWRAAQQTREAYQWRWNFLIDRTLLVWSVATVQQWRNRLLWVTTSNSVVVVVIVVVIVVVAPAPTIVSLHSATTTAAKDNNNGNRSNKQASSLRIVVNYTTSLKIICKNLRK